LSGRGLRPFTGSSNERAAKGHVRASWPRPSTPPGPRLDAVDIATAAARRQRLDQLVDELILQAAR
jgi:hypothetical protein